MPVKKYAWAGTIYLAPVNREGVLQGNFTKPGNVYPMSIQVQTKLVEEISALHDTAGQTLDVKSTIEKVLGSMTFRYFNAEALANALNGSVTEMTGISGTINDADLVAPEKPGQYVEFGHQNVSSVVIKDDTDTTTYAAGTDYEVDQGLGMLTTIDGGAIAAGVTLHMSYTYAAETGYRIEIAKNTQPLYAIKGNMRNLYDETAAPIPIYLYCVRLTADDGVTVISTPDSEGEEITYSLTLITPKGKTTPGVVDGVPM